MTLQELINELNRRPSDAPVFVRAPVQLSPSGLSSYRGHYEQLAINCKLGGYVIVQEVMRMARDAIGRTFDGYKGGNYRMHENTRLWIANHGEASGYMLDRVVRQGGVVYLVGKRVT